TPKLNDSESASAQATANSRFACCYCRLNADVGLETDALLGHSNAAMLRPHDAVHISPVRRTKDQWQKGVLCRVSSLRLVMAFIAAAIVAFIQSSLGQPSAALPNPTDLPSQATLPDPLIMLDGRKVTTREMWFKERRPELIRLFQHYMYGQLPPKPADVTSKVERVDASGFGGKATLSEVTVRFGPAEVPPIHLMLVVPNQRTSPAPVILGMNYFGNHTLVRDPKVMLNTSWMPERGAGVVNNRATEASRGSWAEIWRIEDIIDRGYALATFYNGDIDEVA